MREKNKIIIKISLVQIIGRGFWRVLVETNKKNDRLLGLDLIARVLN